MNSTLNDTGAESPLEVVAEEVALMNQPIIRAFFLVAYLAVFIFCIFGEELCLFNQRLSVFRKQYDFDCHYLE